MKTVITYHGLTHECDDPNCHVPGFIATLTLRDNPPPTRAAAPYEESQAIPATAPHPHP